MSRLLAGIKFSYAGLEGGVQTFGTPEYQQVVVETGQTQTSAVTAPSDAPAGLGLFTVSFIGLGALLLVWRRQESLK